MRVAMSVCVYYSLDHIFPKHGGGCSQRWELQCLYVYIIPLITYFPIMEGDAERNENCDVCVCILFPWSPISPNMEGLPTEMRIAMYMCILFLDHLFAQHEGCCREKWELQCLYVYIIPLITSFTDLEGLLTAMRIAMYICILFPWSPIFPTWTGVLREMRIAMSVCVYYSLDHIFPKHGGVCWEKWELQCLCVYIIPLITYFPKHGGVCSHKWELQCLYVYIIPFITYFPNMVGVAERNENCNVCVCILFPWSPNSPNMEGLFT